MQEPTCNAGHGTIERVSESAEPYKEFIREMTLRIERALREFARDSREDRRMIAAEMRTMHAEIRDLREESRAQTSALLKLIDGLDGGGAAPA